MVNALLSSYLAAIVSLHPRKKIPMADTSPLSVQNRWINKETILSFHPHISQQEIRSSDEYMLRYSY